MPLLVGQGIGVAVWRSSLYENETVYLTKTRSRLLSIAGRSGHGREHVQHGMAGDGDGDALVTPGCRKQESHCRAAVRSACRCRERWRLLPSPGPASPAARCLDGVAIRSQAVDPGGAAYVWGGRSERECCSVTACSHQNTHDSAFDRRPAVRVAPSRSSPETAGKAPPANHSAPAARRPAKGTAGVGE